ncbi:alpha-tocopherol transfer protein-like isoform X2 [Leptopilina heterotoma]|uniref:alpha-tocopherol transfer protein-like isoform X2 n=1 Tax=Leptopilina heterotoma TaxID=63436 RepID=UPI001CA840AE|nr:alpha-tocopherol transfer protein-like isoform X2 [Leptopilina heterotoma]XP_043466266.1 alpha-tocopherol transfer protein-like isoform X2 [Leptopilina heterotoma]XP_043466267.1 alpha-tocopherol transfer protein-like isoform X2 [Leptopilina heterotoma]XP_043466268.1 alpha-tocopherol transfer protein-like isoform X2 [Leptopilina heterotoma]XP_043466269.1 alpha-tocopherol transfer protein-like isoform X2 [Leptopilina heterotoma]
MLLVESIIRTLNGRSAHGNGDVKEELRKTAAINEGQIDSQKINRSVPIISNSVNTSIKDEFESNVKTRNGNDRCIENKDGKKRLEENSEFKSRESLDENDDDEDENENENEKEEELSLDLEEPSQEVMEYARRELGETEEVKCQTLQELREMIYERGECSPQRMDDAFLIRFLRARNFNIHRAHRLVVNYYNFKEEHHTIHKNVNPLEMRHIGDDDVMTVPAYRTQCGRRMMIFRIGNWDPRKYSVEELFKATVIVLELGILEPRAQVLGGVVIFDLEGITMAHAWTITPQIASMVIALMVTSFPMKTHAIHILNQSWVFDAIFAVFKPLLDSRMQGKIYFHGHDMSSLHQHVAPGNLPKKYGGTQEELPYYKWIDSLSKKPIVVKEMHQVGYIIPEEILKTVKDL